MLSGSLVAAVPTARQTNSSGPVFAPPSGHAGDGFVCDYSAMGPEWSSCSTPDNRGCWITNGTFQYNVTTDNEKLMPKGITRKYNLDVVDGVLAPDGFQMPHGQLFNGTFPGPWLKACWGDDIEITVTNRLKNNGTR